MGLVMNSKLHTFGILLVITLIPGNLVRSQTNQKNVLFIAVDDLRPQISSFLDDPDKPPFLHPPMWTPNMDRLAAKSLVLRNAHVQFAVCGPSRASLMTGRRPDTTHVYDLDTYWREVGGNFSTIPQYFKEHGYESIGMGKIFHPGNSSGGDDPLSWSRDYFRSKGDGNWGAKNVSWQAVSQERINEAPLPDQQIAYEAIKVLREMANEPIGKPFFIAVGFKKPHLPFTFPEKYLDHYDTDSISLPGNPYAPVNMPEIAWSNYGELIEFYDIAALNVTGEINTTLPDEITRDLRRAYYASVTFIDALIGEVMDTLESLGLANNTIVAFWSDHGFQLGEHGEWCKHTNFELSTRAPLMVHVPGLTDPGVVSQQLVEMVDLFPTLVDAAGLPSLQVCPPNSTQIGVCTEGSSLLPLVDGGQPWKQRVFSQFNRGKTRMGYSMRTAAYRYTEWVGFNDAPAYTPDWEDMKGAELYDHTVDWEENVNRADYPDYQDLRIELSEQLRAGWREAWS